MHKILTCIFLLGSCPSLFAAGLGMAQVVSPQGEALRIMVPVTYQARDEFQALRLDVLQSAVGSDQGVPERAGTGEPVTDGRYSTLKVPEADGRPGYFIVRSMEKNREPELAMILRLSTGGRGALMRSYRLAVPANRDEARRACPEADAVMAFGVNSTTSQSSFSNADADRFVVKEAKEPVSKKRGSKTAAAIANVPVPAGLPALPEGVVKQP